MKNRKFEYTTRRKARSQYILRKQSAKKAAGVYSADKSQADMTDNGNGERTARVSVCSDDTGECF